MTVKPAIKTRSCCLPFQTSASQVKMPQADMRTLYWTCEKMRNQINWRPHLLALVVLAGTEFSSLRAQDMSNWNQFRGPGGDGVSTAKDLPTEFDEANNVRWKIAIPGRGWSSPVVWKNEIWLTTGDESKKELRAICVDAASGKVLKDIKVFDMIERKVDPAYVHDSPHLNSVATPTSVVEDDHVFVSFGSQGLAGLNRKTGEKVWERRDLRVYQPVRQGSSPIVDDRNLYVAYDGTDQQFFVALDKKTGDTRWKMDRNVSSDWNATLRARGLTPKKDSGGKPGDNRKAFATAHIINVDGQRQLIAPAAEATIAYDPGTGRELWRAMHPGGFNVSARPLYAHGMVYVFTSGLTGYLMGIRPDGFGDVTTTHVEWSTTRGTPHIPSPVIVGDLMFLVSDKGGIVRCVNAKTGDEVWKKRISGNHWASPILANGKLYFTSREGEIAVLPASDSVPDEIVKNRMNASFIASPAVAGSSLILRSTTHLYCVASGYKRTAEQITADVYPKSNAGKAKPKQQTASRKKRLSAFAAKLKEMVGDGTLSKEDGTELWESVAGGRK